MSTLNVNSIQTAGGISPVLVSDIAKKSDLSASGGSALVGYLPAGTGAVATNVEKELQQLLKLVNFLPDGYVTDGSVDYTTEINAAIAAAVAGNKALYINPGEWRHTAALTVTARVVIFGAGKGVSKFLSVNCDAFDIATGVSFVSIQGITIAQATRYTSTPNAYTAIRNNGTTVNQNSYHTYRDIFIDGFEFGFDCNAVSSSSFINCQAAYTHKGITFSLQCLNNAVSQCTLAEMDTSATPPAANGYGIKVGDGTINCEGTQIDSCTIYGVARGLWVHGSIDVLASKNILDAIAEFGVIADSTGSAGSVNNNFSDNYIGVAGSGGSAGVYLVNAFAGTDSQNNGTIVRGNEILAYSGATLTYGILIDGAYEKRNSITENRVSNTAAYDCRITTGTDHRVSGNLWRSASGFSTTVAIPDIQYINNTGNLGAASPSPVGSFTPVVFGTTVAGSITYGVGTQSGEYKIIDDYCFFSLSLNWTANSGGTGSMRVSGLPVARYADAAYTPAVTVGAESITFPASCTTIIGFVRSDGVIELRGSGNGVSPTPVDMDSQATGTLRISGAYKVAA